MNVPGRAAVQRTTIAALLVLALATVAGAVRVLPWLVAPDVPWRVSLPFARALLGVGLETALLCAPPIGWALAAASLVERGEARAFFASGVSPVDLVRRTVPHAVACALFAGIAALAWGTEAAAPGRMVRAMVEESKASCSNAVEPRVFHVPFVPATWLCAAGATPVVVGSLPSSAGEFTARDFVISDDLRTLDLRDTRLLLVGQGVRIHAGELRVRGLPPWGRASNLTPGVRAGLVSATGALLALVVAWLLVRRSTGGPVAALWVGAAGPIAALATMNHLERADHAALAYAWVPTAAALGLLAAHGWLVLWGRATTRTAPR